MCLLCGSIEDVVSECARVNTNILYMYMHVAFHIFTGCYAISLLWMTNR